MWTLEKLYDHCNTCWTEVNNKWVPSRPINWTCRSFKQRVREAWAVFTGKAEAFTWPEGQ